MDHISEKGHSDELELANGDAPLKMEQHLSSSHYKTSLERRLVLKSDIILTTLMSLAYLLAYLDRNNIGNARLMGFEKDTHMSDSDYYDAIQIFYAGFLVTVFPGNLFIKSIGANRLIGGAVVFFGVMVCIMSTAQNSGTVYALRFLIGCAEGCLQSSAIYLSYWYKRDEVCTRIAIFYSAATLSGAFSGLAAYGIQSNLDGADGRHAWQWLYIIEGALGIFFGIIIWLLMLPLPQKLKNHWLFSKEEADLAVQRFQAYNTVKTSIQLKQVWASLLDPKTWFFCFVATANTTVLAALGAFLPSIITSFGYTTVHSQLMTVIPYAVAFVVMILVASISDRVNKKAFFILGCLTVVVIGLVILMAVSKNGAKMFATCLVIGGIYPSVVMQIAWIQINICGQTKRAITYGLSYIFGQGLAMVAAHVYIDPPRYLVGHGSMLAFTGFGIINTAAAYFWMKYQNKKRDSILEEYSARGEEHPNMEKTYEEVYDNHVGFRYVL